MRRPLVLCAVSFLLGALAAWLIGQRQSTLDCCDSRTPPDGRLSGTLDDLLSEDTLVDQDTVDERWNAAEVAPGPHPGSALPLPDGGAPSDEYTVKGIADRFHTTASPHYPRVRAQVWFRNAADAQRAGLHRWDA
ncbi:hypothetical protein ACFPM7_02950 [Actinokineospora guangxiensis]|uniref:Uncharacterized protein n=1 Tax=Actinokineospora guangxiensis TaxID=1490288 RepID=A0ABW0EF27_9PSEU